MTVQRASTISVIGTELVILAAMTYIMLGAHFLFPQSDLLHFRLPSAIACLYLGVATAVAIVHSGPARSATIFIVFATYLFASTPPCRCYSCQLMPPAAPAHSAVGPTHPPLLHVPALYAALWACAGVVVLVRRHRDSWTVRMFALAAIAGVVDFLLPALAFIGAPIWQPDFLGRVLDVALYLPFAVMTIRWLETKSEYMPPAQATKEQG